MYPSWETVHKHGACRALGVLHPFPTFTHLLYSSPIFLTLINRHYRLRLHQQRVIHTLPFFHPSSHWFMHTSQSVASRLVLWEHPRSGYLVFFPLFITLYFSRKFQATSLSTPGALSLCIHVRKPHRIMCDLVSFFPSFFPKPLLNF